MQRKINCRLANFRRFFRYELENIGDLDSLAMEAYILVNRVRFSYHDVKSLSRIKRARFIKLYKEDQENQERQLRAD